MPPANAEIRRDLSRPAIGQFLGNLLRDPLAVGAVAPSSRHLANLMVTGMKAGSRVIELGAGTGAVTAAILNAGVRASDLTLVEQNEEFAAILSTKFPDTTIVRGNAVSLRHHICTESGKADFVVSGLPLLLFPTRSKARLLSQIFKTLSDEGCLYQYTYGVRCPISRKLLRNLGLEASLVKFTPFNIPPAFVYRVSRA
jgi:phosphatidylethanolamine/phosphatidyl-N-methylethanolamine N-methyltransferase